MRRMTLPGLPVSPLVLMAVAAWLSPRAEAAVSVVTSTSDLADFARQVGGDKVDVYCILKEGQDPHFCRPTPGEQRRLSKAKLFLQTGLDLETWAPKLIEGAQNPKLFIMTCSRGVKPLEVYTQGVSPAQGDVHPAGNPHIMHDPANARRAVSNVLAGLLAVDPGNGDYYRSRAKTYLHELDARITQWEKRIAPFKGEKVVAYHKSWPYFEKRFGVDFVGFVEPFAGIPPKGKDIANLVQLMKHQKVKVIVTQSFYPRANVDSIARQTGAKVVELAGYPGSEPGTDTYVEMMDRNIKVLADALR